MKKMIIALLMIIPVTPSCAIESRLRVVEIPAHQQKYNYTWYPGTRKLVWNTRSGKKRRVFVPKYIEVVTKNGKIVKVSNKKYLRR